MLCSCVQGGKKTRCRKNTMLEFIAGSAGTMKGPGSPCPSKIKRTFVKGDFTQVKFPQQTEDYSSFLSVFLIKIIESPTAPTITPNSENGKSLRLCKRVLFISAPPRQRSIPNSIKAMPFKDLLSMIEIPFQSQICRIDTHKV